MHTLLPNRSLLLCTFLAMISYLFPTIALPVPKDYVGPPREDFSAVNLPADFGEGPDYDSEFEYPDGTIPNPVDGVIPPSAFDDIPPLDQATTSQPNSVQVNNGPPPASLWEDGIPNDVEEALEAGYDPADLDGWLADGDGVVAAGSDAVVAGELGAAGGTAAAEGITEVASGATLGGEIVAGLETAGEVAAAAAILK